MDSSARQAAIRRALDAALHPELLEIEDESHLHHGHVGARSGKGHFRIRIVASKFAGNPPLARHRLVYSALAELMMTEIHALSIDARSPNEIAP